MSRRAMNSKQRVRTALARQEPDRVPINYMANAGIDRRLKDHFSLAADDNEGLLRALGVDFRGVKANYTGPKLHADIPERGVKVDDWGIHRRWIEHASGGYWDYCDFPLKDADEKQIAAWPMPDPDNFDYQSVADDCKRFKDFGVVIGSPGMADIINRAGMMRSMEQTMMDLATEDPAGLLLTERRIGIQLEVLARSLEAAKGGIDLLWIGDDLGTQRGPIISLQTYRKLIRPLHQKFIDLASSYDIPVMIHSCGSSSWAFHDFIDMGIKAVDTLQPEAAKMEPRYLKDTFGDRLAFHGCISTAGPVATGSVQDISDYCHNILDIMMPGGGYCFAPTHMLQDNSPTENVLAMYEIARTDGTY